MKIIIAVIIGLVMGAGGYYYYEHNQATLQDPSAVYTKLGTIKDPKTAQNFIQKAVSGWVTDAKNQLLVYPKGWKKVAVTVNKQTFNVVTPDTANPPTYYVSFEFPKTLIPKTNLIKCIGLDKTSKTDTCLVGNNAQVDAYFNIMKWIKENATIPSFAIPGVQMAK